MKTEDIEYNGQVFTCRKIIDFSAMIELLSALAKRQEYLEKKLDFQDERINDKDKRISDLEVKILGASQSKEENFPSDKDLIKEKGKQKSIEEEDLNDSDLDAFLNKEDKTEEKEQNEEGENDENKNEDKNKEEDNKKEDNKDNEEKEDDDKNKEKKDEEDNKEKKEEEINKDINFNENVSEKTKQKETNKENENKDNDKDKDKDANIDNNKDDKTNNDEILKKIIKKLKVLEGKINNLEKLESLNESKSINIYSSKGSSKKGSDGKIILLGKKFDEFKDEFKDELKKMKEDMSKMKEKVEDFNIYDIFKSDSGDTNVDVCKGLVMALENKVFKKLGFIDIKLKKNDEDIFQNHTEIKNINALLDGIKDRENKTSETIDELKNNNEEKNNNLNKQIKELNEKINEIDDKINKNNKLNSNEHKELSDKIKELEQKMQQKNDDIDISKYVKVQGQMNPEDLKLLKELSTRINELEKIMKIKFGKFSPKEVQDRIENLETEMAKKGNKYEINELNDRLLYYDENEKDLNFKMDTIQQYNEKARGDMQQIIKKIEYLSGELNRISNDSADVDKGKGPIIDITRLVDTNLFNETKKEINKKFDKIRLSFEEIARNLDDILEKLSHTPSDADFAQFQSIIKNLVEELKLSISKKYADKSETNKSIKFLETQIKTIQESFTKKMEGADNWLLAKKPLNNYVCASCESIIRGELDKRSEYIPWNKYPNRDEKSYRMGHGFSRMLQMINEDKKKLQDKEKDNISDEDKSKSDSEQNFVINGNVKLPKLKHKHLNSGKIKNNVNFEEDNNLPFDTNNPYIDIYPMSSVDRPKIMKIYKRSKQAIQSSYFNRNVQMRNGENLPNLIVKTSPNEKEVQAQQGIKSESITQPNEQ